MDNESLEFSFDIEPYPPEITLEEFESFLSRFLAKHNLPIQTSTQMVVDGYYINRDGTRGEPAPGLFNENIRASRSDDF